MKKKIEFKAKMTSIGSSRYILIPNKVREYENLVENDVLTIVIEKVEKEFCNEDTSNTYN